VRDRPRVLRERTKGLNPHPLAEEVNLQLAGIQGLSGHHCVRRPRRRRYGHHIRYKFRHTPPSSATSFTHSPAPVNCGSSGVPLPILFVDANPLTDS